MPKYYTIQEVAEMLKVTERTIKDWMKEKKIRYSRLAGQKTVRIADDAIKEFVESKEVRKE